VVNSSRNEQLIKPLCDTDTTETGVQIKFITDQEGPLLVKLKAGGLNTSADLPFMVDADNLWLRVCFRWS